MNQRLATEAAKTRAIEPVPMPTTTPQSATKCHGLVIQIVASAPVPTVVNAVMTTLRIPKRSMSAAAKGAVNPKRSTFMEIASEIESRDQPNACSNGIIRTEGAER